MNEMLRQVVTTHRDYWQRMLARANSGIIPHIEVDGNPLFPEARLMVSFCREMLSTCERWLEQTSPEAADGTPR